MLNGANTVKENLFALRVAQTLGKPGSGGSDAHATQGIGTYCIELEKDCESQEELLAELHATRFHACHGLLDGELQRFTETSLAEPEP